eukprot:Phypoly_transcript_12689.p1 GENE.Phypoly_transcript_12689~~Phypoly_transcript_12689.p1  ORF type:complete len:246 (+),score=40.43 Phypoly_transcript_12689:311-1048(+)
MGTTGEFLYMSQKLRIEGLKALIDEFHGHFIIYAHATGDTVAETLELVRFLESYEKKVDATVILPMYYLHDDAAVLNHLKRDFSEFTKIPLVLYNNPSITQDKNIPFSIIDVPKKELPFIAMKDSSGDDEVLKTYVKRFIVYAGNERKIVSSLKLRAQGAVAGMGNINALPQQLFETGDMGKIKSIQDEICRLSPILTAGGGRPFIAGFKYAAHILGIMETVLAPGNLYDISEDAKRAIENELKK